MEARTAGPAGIEFRLDPLTDTAVVGLLEAHLTEAAEHSPPGTGHALDLQALRAPDITFWSAWEDGRVVACGAIRELSASHGEIKSMHTVRHARGRGVGRAMVEHLLDAARGRGYARVSLETGGTPGFEAARSLYRRVGFEVCGPFGPYSDDPASVYMTRALP